MSGLVKDRFRNQTVSFRVSPEERRQLEARIIISGMPKGQYFIQSLLQQQIQTAVDKYQSDRLSIELRRLRELIETLEDDRQELLFLFSDCKALLEQLQAVTDGADNTKLQPSDFNVKTQE